MLNVQARTLGNVAVLSLEGQIVIGETETLRNAVNSLALNSLALNSLADGAGNSLTVISSVKLDLARVTTVDAAGLGVLLALREQAEARGIRFELMNVNDRVRMVLTLTRLDTVFRISSAVEYLPAFSRSRRESVTPLASCA